MDYLEHRVELYDRFKTLLERPLSQQCGNAFILQRLDCEDTITPELNMLGAGSFGIVFSIDHPYLASLNINATIKLSDCITDNDITTASTDNANEILFGYYSSNLVKRNITPHLPLYTVCRNNSCVCPSIEADGVRKFKCDFEQTTTNMGGNKMSFSKHFTSMSQKGVNYIVRKNNNCLISFAEKLDDSYYNYLNVIKVFGDIVVMNSVLSVLAQTIIGLKALKDIPDHVYHRDLHIENILFKVLDPTYGNTDLRHSLRYVLPNQNIINIRHYNKLFVLWDFGKIKKRSDTRLEFEFDYLSRVFHLTDHTFFTEGEITQVMTDQWFVSYNYDIARLLASLYEHLLNTTNCTITLNLCKTLFIYYIRKLNTQVVDNETIEPLNFIMEIDTILGQSSEQIRWRDIFNNGIDVPDANILHTYYPSSQGIDNLELIPSASFGKMKSVRKTKLPKGRKSNKKEMKSVRKTKLPESCPKVTPAPSYWVGCGTKLPEGREGGRKSNKKEMKSVRKTKLPKGRKSNKKEMKSVRKAMKSVRKTKLPEERGSQTRKK